MLVIVYVQVVLIVAHIFPWFYENGVFFSQILKTKSIMFFMKMES